MPFSLSRIGRTGRLDARECKYTRNKTKTHYGDVRGIRIDFGKTRRFRPVCNGTYKPASTVKNAILGNSGKNERYSVGGDAGALDADHSGNIVENYFDNSET